MRSQSWASALFVAVLLGVLVLNVLLLAPVRGDAPIVITNPDASRTVMWNMTNSQGILLQNATIEGKQAVLQWQRVAIPWLSPSEFVSNGTADASISAGGHALELAADATNYVADGEFATSTSWSYVDGPTGNVTAAWDPASKAAVLAYATPAKNETPWDRMENLSYWTFRAAPTVTGGLDLTTTLQHEGGGALNVSFTLASGPSLYAGAERTSANWSGYNRLLIWVRAFSGALTFNVTAQVGGAPRSTTAQALVVGWQQVVVNLRGLGNSSERGNLQNVLLRVNGRNVSSTSVYFDDAQLSNSKNVSEAASVSQSIEKANSTTPGMGSAVLAFDWSVTDALGVRSLAASVNVTGSNAFGRTFGTAVSGDWRRSAIDLSEVMAAAGTYTLSFRLGVVVDTTSASSAHLWIDNVSLIFPSRRNGTYLSDAVSLGVASQLLTVNWTASIPPSTSIRLGLRTGNTSNLSGPTWSPWETWDLNGTYNVSRPGSRYYQVRIELGTTNASASPEMFSLVLDTRHRFAVGTVTSEVFRMTESAFLKWRAFGATVVGGPMRFIDFFVRNGSQWDAVPPAGDLTGIADQNLSWMAVLHTTDGLGTPALVRVNVTYEFRGPITGVIVSPGPTFTLISGASLRFEARAIDAGGHPVEVPVFDWRTDDREGSLGPDGTYTAGIPGVHNVSAFVPGTLIYGSVQVNVLEKSLLPVDLAFLSYPLVVAAAIGLAYGAYELAIRRLFAIDDVFLISKDGRLMMHNTRRMRADRDEDILSSMLTAILTFLQDFDREENGELHRFDLGGKTALLERGAHAYLAAVYSGRVPRWAGKDLRRFMQDLETRFGEAFSRWSGSPEDLQGLKDFSHRFVSKVRYRSLRGKRDLAT